MRRRLTAWDREGRGNPLETKQKKRASNPARGGYREGSGQKAADPENPNTVAITVKVSPALAAALDALRGDLTRSAFLRALAEREVSGNDAMRY